MHKLTQAKKLVPSISFSCLGFWIATSPFEISGYAPEKHSNITASQIAHQLLLNGKTHHSTRQLMPNLNTDGCNPNFTKPFCLTELKQFIGSLKNKKATGLDNIMTEELKHFGQKALVWLLQLFNNCLVSMRIPKILV